MGVRSTGPPRMSFPLKILGRAQFMSWIYEVELLQTQRQPPGRRGEGRLSRGQSVGASVDASKG